MARQSARRGMVTGQIDTCISGSVDPALIKKLKEWKINLNERLDILN